MDFDFDIGSKYITAWGMLRWIQRDTNAFSNPSKDASTKKLRQHKHQSKQHRKSQSKPVQNKAQNEATSITTLANRLRKVSMGNDGHLKEVHTLCNALRVLELRHETISCSRVDIRNSAGKTALHMAAWRGPICIVDALLAANADIDRISTG